MISEKHSQAARINGARSRGPVTPEGKAISSRNALRHGLLAKTVLLSNEDAELFKHYFYLCVERFNPVGDLEMSMVEEMVASGWRLHRGLAMEKHIFECGIAANPGLPPIEQITAAFCDPANIEPIERLGRYQTRLQNMFMRAYRGLLQLRKHPAKPPTPPPDTVLAALLPNEPIAPCVSNIKHPAPALPESSPQPLAPQKAALKPADCKILPLPPLKPS